MIKKVSVVIPAHNEEKRLASCVAAIRESFSQLARISDGLTLEIVLVANRCSDRTVEIANELGILHIEDENRNLSRIRNLGVKHASGEMILTIDADSLMSENLILNAFKSLNSGSIGGGVMIYPERWSLGIFLTGMFLMPIVLKHRVLAGCFFFLKKDFEKIGGFDEEVLSAEDVKFAIELKALGRSENRSYDNLWSSYITTSCRKFDKFGDWYFVFRPFLVWKLLKHRSKEDANRIWYDFEE